MDVPGAKSIDPSVLREAVTRRLYRRAVMTAQITVPAVPSMIDEYVTMCDNVFAAAGVQYTPEQSAQLRSVLTAELDKAYAASSRSNIVISFHAPFGVGMNYRVATESVTLGGAYDGWVETREGPLFGTEPDARVWALAAEMADAESRPVLDIGAGTGRNALALARRGHPVDAVEMSPKFADIIRAEAERESLQVRVLDGDVFETMDGVRRDYQIIVLAEVVPDFRTTGELRGIFELAADCLAPGGCLVFNAFLARDGYVPDEPTRELGQQCNTMIFTHDELSSAAKDLPLELVGDDSAYEYEHTHLPADAWPPTSWFEGWASGLDVFDVDRDDSPIDLRWLVYRRA
ncbi:class I SAM-dependent methyltransferase [Candidatus Mycobacterium wuenschmannii]|uniref:Class I SAM-dependent methyltransferase n=1 Tax=Candidatus Mycobacterium wuenschmannii TaxID=3027808 RepID=A0ABY8VZN7_9MYCO|nr:class I SAM-dependent methyltransferase [Candidatus Mycobacterium wuenschmannii]WIM89068.1 class I SAM-dependent methyltransferase [Candidatus Mycobacterium wuenschmannii]